MQGLLSGEQFYRVTEDGPSDLAIQENAWGLARYARAVQEAGLVPIIEPEILMDGNHSIETTSKVQQRVITEVYKACHLNGVYPRGNSTQTIHDSIWK